MAVGRVLDRMRTRVGRVSVYAHHKSWWIYYRDAGRVVRRKVAATRADAEQVAAQINAQLAMNAPTLVGFTPASPPKTNKKLNSRKYRRYHRLDTFGLRRS